MANKDPKDTKKDEEESGASVGATLLDDKIAAAIGKALESSMPLAMAAAAAQLGQALNPKKPDPVLEKYSPSDRCGKCQQLKRACKEQHVKLVVAPANPRRFHRFPGVIVGGVLYISPRPGAPIFVPRDNDILYTLQTWETEEENLREGHVINHDSGQISPVEGQSNVHHANTMGFRGKLEGSPDAL